MTQEQYHNPTILSDREHQIAVLISDGLDDREMAEELGIKKVSVRDIRRRLRIKRNKVERTVDFFSEHDIF